MFLDVSTALSTHLDAMVDLPPVSYENSDSYLPSVDELYIKERTIFGRGFGVELNSTKEQRFGTYELTVYAPKGLNKFATLTEVDKLINHFYRGLALVGDNIELSINKNEIGRTISDDTYHIVPMYVSFWFYA